MNNNGVRDNYSYGKVGDFLFENIETGSDLFFVTDYFTILEITILEKR